MNDHAAPGGDPSLHELGLAVLSVLRTHHEAPLGPPPPVEPEYSGSGPGRSEIPATVVLRPIASGVPLGFFGLVAAASITGVQAFGILPSQASLAVGLLLLPTVVAQLIGGISSILGRDVVAATLLLTFSGVWLGTALIYLSHPPMAMETLAIWYFAVGAVILAIIFSATGKLALSLLPTIGLPTLLVTGIWLLGDGTSQGLGQAAGLRAFCLAAAGLDAGIALLFEDARRRTILPTVRLGAMKDAFVGDFSAQLKDIEHEAGVRRYL